MRARLWRGSQRGGALVEYVIVVLLLVLVLLVPPPGQSTSVIQQLADAIDKAYTSFMYALSVSWI